MARISVEEATQLADQLEKTYESEAKCLFEANPEIAAAWVAGAMKAMFRILVASHVDADGIALIRHRIADETRAHRGPQ